MERDGLDEERTRELEAADGSAPYIDTSTDFGGDTPTAEIVPNGALLVADSTPIEANPVSAYLARLAESSRRPMRANLETIARLVSGGRVSAMDLAWWNLRYEHTSLIRSTLAASYAPATANLMLSAMRGVLKSCFRLGYMSADDLQRTSDVPPARGSRLPRPRRRPRRALRPLPPMLRRRQNGAGRQGRGAVRPLVRVRP